MASLCRSTAFSASRAAALRSRPMLSKPVPSGGAVRLLSRSMAAVGTVESLMPLHSAIAAARLRSFIAEDSSRWSIISQGIIFGPCLKKGK